MKNLLLTILLLCCSCHVEQKTPIRRTISDRDKWHALAMIIKKRYKTDMTIGEIAAELSYQEYLLSLEKQQ